MNNKIIDEGWEHNHFIICLPMDFFSCHRSLMFRGCCISPTFDDADAACHRHLSAIGCCLLPLVSLGTTAEAEAESPKNLPVTLAAELPIFTFQQRLGYPQLTCFGRHNCRKKIELCILYWFSEVVFLVFGCFAALGSSPVDRWESNMLCL